MHRGEHLCEGISERLADSTPIVALIVFRYTASRHKNALLSHLRLFWGEEIRFSVAWPVRQEPETCQGNHNADDSFQDDEPLPGVELSNTIHVS